MLHKKIETLYTSNIIKKYKFYKLTYSIFILFFILENAYSALPNLGASDLIDYDSKTEQKLGAEFSTELHKQFKLIKDPVVVSIINKISSRITQNSPPRSFRFYIVNDKEINAFAGPNGIIGINSGLVMKVKNEDELASVIAHEVAHVTQRHLSRTLEKQPKAIMSNLASVLAALLVGSQNINAGVATLMAGVGLNLQNQLKNSRIYEMEADNLGIKYLYKSGYNPKAMVDFFTKLEQEYPTQGLNVPEFLRTHPITKRRMAEALNRAEEFTSVKQSKSTELLNILKIHLELFSKEDLNLKLSKHEKCYQDNLLAINKPQLNKNDLHLTCLENAIRSRPKQILYQLLYAKINIRLKQNKSLNTLNLLNDLYPNDIAVVLNLAKALEVFKSNKEAIKYLQSQEHKFRNYDLIFKELSRLMSKQKQKDYSLYYSALASKTIGDIKSYQYFLNISQRIAKKQRNKQLLKKINIIKKADSSN